MWLRLGAIVWLITAASLPAQTNAPYDRQPPGRLIDIGGRQITCPLHRQRKSDGNPHDRRRSVLHRLGSRAPRVAENTLVCSYDRAGLAWIDSAPADEPVAQTVGDLHTLRRSADEKGPYVLVGASIGGIFIRACQRAFSDEIGALVFTNSSGRVGMNVKGKGGLIWNLSEEDLPSAYPLPASAKGPAPTRVGEPFDRLPPSLPDRVLDAIVRALTAARSRVPFPRPVLHENDVLHPHARLEAQK